MTYIDGFVIPVAPGKKEAYRKMTAEVAPFFMEYGALEIVECFEDDVPDGKATDFRRAVDAEEGEKIVFSWIVWPSREVRDDGQKRMMEDPRMKPPAEMPFDGKRMIFGGFTPIFQSGSSRIEAARAPEREPA
ncbi:DUF1428 domain-containing protein [Allosphingosinicella sp.]|uniref:DUF1428 domain-containing protein n=1 Tax=Allosphingosinicella sp. TaxID=2823234 RepID=UPI002FC0DC5C